MLLKTEILAELQTLIFAGIELDSAQDIVAGGQPAVTPERDFHAFVVGAFACIKRVAGEKSDYFTLLRTGNMEGAYFSANRSLIKSLVGSLIALRRAVENGLLDSLELRLRANIHDDFLLQAKVLLDAGYHVAGMVLIGGVLEDHLRKLCDNRGLACDGKGSLGRYNDLLRDVYPQAAWRQIQSIADLRNCSAHFDGASVDAKHVELAHTFVSQMIVNYPA
jgi:hypothetical protein